MFGDLKEIEREGTDTILVSIISVVTEVLSTDYPYAHLCISLHFQAFLSIISGKISLLLLVFKILSSKEIKETQNQFLIKSNPKV